MGRQVFTWCALLSAGLFWFSSCSGSLASASIDACPTTCISPWVCDPAAHQCSSTVGMYGPDAGASPVTGDLPCAVTTLLTTECASCHGAVPAGGASLRLLTRADLLAPSPSDPTVTLAQRSSSRMHAVVAEMPPAPAAPVPSSMLTAFDAWVAAGAPAGSCAPSGTAGGSANTGGGSSGAGGSASGTAGGSAATSGGASGTGGGDTSGTGGGTAGGPMAGGGGGGGGGTSSLYCRPCQTTAACGGAPNYCLGSGATGNCGLDCSAGQACPSGASCVGIRNASGTTVGRNCVPTSGQCSSSGAGGGSGSAGGSGTGGGSANACSTNPDTFSNYARTFFTANCSNCHHHTGEFTTASSITSSVRSRISTGNMPPNGLTAAERARILAWVDCGKKP